MKWWLSVDLPNLESVQLGYAALDGVDADDCSLCLQGYFGGYCGYDRFAQANYVGVNEMELCLSQKDRVCELVAVFECDSRCG